MIAKCVEIQDLEPEEVALASRLKFYEGKKMKFESRVYQETGEPLSCNEYPFGMQPGDYVEMVIENDDIIFLQGCTVYLINEEGKTVDVIHA